MQSCCITWVFSDCLHVPEHQAIIWRQSEHWCAPLPHPLVLCFSHAQQQHTSSVSVSLRKASLSYLWQHKVRPEVFHCTDFEYVLPFGHTSWCDTAMRHESGWLHRVRLSTVLVTVTFPDLLKDISMGTYTGQHQLSLEPLCQSI